MSERRVALYNEMLSGTMDSCLVQWTAVWYNGQLSGTTDSCLVQWTAAWYNGQLPGTMDSCRQMQLATTIAVDDVTLDHEDGGRANR